MNLYRIYFVNDLPFRHRIDPLFRIANCLKAWLFPRRQFTIENFRVAVTNICNAACCFCTYPQTKMAGKVMKLEMFTAAMRYFDRRFAVDLTPAVGDPLVDPGLKDKVQAMIADGYRWQFTTNSILIEKHMDWMLAEAAHCECVYLSIPGFDPEQYEVQYGVNKGHQVVTGLLKFLIANEMMGQPLRVRVQIRNREKESETLDSPCYQDFKPYLHGRVTLHFTRIWDNWSWALDMSTWSEHMRKRLRWCPQIKRPCRNLRSGLVNPDGGLRLCGCRVVGTDQDDLLIGKVGDSMESLNAAATKIRDSFYLGVFPNACQGCSFYNPE